MIKTTPVAVLANTSTSNTETYRGSFAVKPDPINYGQAGLRTPTSFELRVSNQTVLEAGKEVKTYVSYSLDLHAKTERTSFKAGFSFPAKATIASYDYGHGFGGYIYDAPTEILKAVTEATGFDIATIVEEILAKVK
jgi:hypothetical protein